MKKENENNNIENKITYHFFDAFQKIEVNRWDAIVDKDVAINSPAGYNLSGLQTLKDWINAFGQVAYQIDLIDEHLAIDGEGNGRAFITVNLNWKHEQEFFGLQPTGREGTSVETLLFTIVSNKIVRIDVADNTSDLAIYLWDRGWPMPHNIRPKTIITGVNRKLV
ncbi:nuclear transport factor 2 family protein [Flavobacterium sp. J27]|uniref:nuclear transport factor 2 family protein n=1 Tax=Flavobacterium sp. J27 TaxID=2060419 RepID=UPI0010320DA2|nr:nuclear transport factor 2 family protein [Flavobacterium sp. J27]